MRGARPGRRRRRPRPGWRSSPAARRRAWPDRLPAARPCRRRWGRCARCSRRRWAGATGDAPVRGLQADGAGEGGRDADRAARVAAHGQAHHAGGHGRRAAAAAAAGRERRVPRIAGDAEGRTVGDAFPVEFRGAGLAQQHGAGIGQPLHEHGMGRRRFGRRERRTAPRGPARTAANSPMATGMPSSGPSAAPWRQRSSDSRAPASVPARSSSAKALMIGSARSACSSALRATSMGETSPRRYSSRRRGQGV